MAALSAESGLEQGESREVPDELMAAALRADDGLEQRPGRPESSDLLEELLAGALAEDGDPLRSRESPQEPSAED